MLDGRDEWGGVVGLGALSWEGREGGGLEGAVGDWRPDLVNKSVENSSLDLSICNYCIPNPAKVIAQHTELRPVDMQTAQGKNHSMFTPMILGPVTRLWFDVGEAQSL